MGKKILVIDDDPDSIEIITSILKTNKFKSKGVTESANAIDETQEYNPALIVLDLTMPEPDGWEILRNLKKNSKTSEIPVLMLTNRDRIIDVEKSFKAGANDYIMKPVKSKVLIERIRKLLNLTNEKKP